MYTYKVLPPIRPRQGDLHKPYSDNDSIPDDNHQFSTNWGGSLPNMQSRDIAERYGRSPLFNMSSSTPEEPDALTSGRNAALKQSLDSNASSHLPSLPNRVSNSSSKAKKQKRHISGKSRESGADKPNAFPGKRGRTTPGGQAFDPETGQASAHADSLSHHGGQGLVAGNSTRRSGPTEAQSILVDGPQKHVVHYNVPSQSSSDASFEGKVIFTMINA